MGGLDPSLSNFGMCKGIALFKEGVIKPHKVIVEKISLVTTKTDSSTQYKNEDDLRRARELGSAMLEFFNEVDNIYVEMPVGSQSARAMASYGICVGVVAALGKRVIRVSAKNVKLIATGNPQASKKDMIKWATRMYPELPWLRSKLKGEQVLTNANEHAADAIATLYAGLIIK